MLLLSLLLACGQPTPAPEAEPVEEPTPAATGTNPALAVDLDDPEQCATCHGQVVSEWKESMHHRAHQSRDPVFAAMRTLRMEKQGEQVAGQCAQCHTPRSPDDQEAKAAINGVSCATCHAASHVERDPAKKGAKAFTWAENVLSGPHDLEPGASPVHGTGSAAPHLTDGKTVCLACHDQTKTPGGADACTTGPEYELGSGGESCVSCHMPQVDGASGSVSTRETHAHHGFLGPHRAWYQDDAGYLSTGVELTVALAGETLTAELENMTHHAFPTGFPGRLVVIKAIGKDASGEVVWSSFADDPSADPQALLRKVYVDEAGKPVMPPFSVEMKADTRLRPDEVRTLTWTVPDTVQEAEVVVKYSLMPPPAAKALGLTEAVEAEPREVTRASATR